MGNTAIQKVKSSVDLKTVASVFVGLVLFGGAVYALSKSGGIGSKVAGIAKGVILERMVKCR